MFLIRKPKTLVISKTTWQKKVSKFDKGRNLEITLNLTNMLRLSLIYNLK